MKHLSAVNIRHSAYLATWRTVVAAVAPKPEPCVVVAAAVSPALRRPYAAVVDVVVERPQPSDDCNQCGRSDNAGASAPSLRRPC